MLLSSLFRFGGGVSTAIGCYVNQSSSSTRHHADFLFQKEMHHCMESNHCFRAVSWGWPLALGPQRFIFFWLTKLRCNLIGQHFFLKGSHRVMCKMCALEVEEKAASVKAAPSFPAEMFCADTRAGSHLPLIGNQIPLLWNPPFFSCLVGRNNILSWSLSSTFSHIQSPAVLTFFSASAQGLCDVGHSVM